MEKTLTIGRTYAVTTSGTCAVTDANGTLITTAEAGQQVVFVAPTTTVSFSDDSASVVAVFKLALAKTRLFEQLGGGRLPAGYIPALFLESQSNCSIATDYLPTNNTKVEADLVTLNDTYYGRLCGNNGSGSGVGMFAAHLRGLTGGLNCLAFDFGSARTDVFDYMNLNERHTVSFSQAGVYRDGVLVQSIPERTPFVATEPLYVFSVPQSAIGASGCHQLYSFNVFEGEAKVFSFMPCLNENGAPCFFDRVNRQGYENKGSTPFIIGLTVAQARQLGKLPADAETKTLTISLPQSAFVDVETGEIADAAVNAALALAEAKGWIITIQTY